MKNVVLACVSFGLLLCGQSDVLAQDDKALQGTWIIVSMQAKGKLSKALDGTEFSFVDGNMIATAEGRFGGRSAYKANVKTKPQSIDFESLNEGDKGQKRLGIYEINGEDMKLCTCAGGINRPTAFKSEEGSDWELIELKRKK